MSSDEATIHKAGTDDGWHGIISPGSQFPPEKGRYHLYIGFFCPFAHRVNLVRHLKGLTDIIETSIVKPYPKGENGWPGWCFPAEGEYEGSTVDHLFGSKYLHEVYFRADKEYKGRYSVPLLWDKKQGTVVNNESAEILRWLPTAFDSIITEPRSGINLYPSELQAQIDEVSVWLRRDLNSGVYKAGFASGQEDYEKGVIPVFAALNKLEELIYINGGPYVLGKTLTELDLLAYPTIIRFDTVYVGHFKCNIGTIRHDYPVINNWLKNLYHNVKGFKETTEFRHIKENYYKSHSDVNPKAITPVGPYPNVEEDVEQNWANLKPGGVKSPEVLQYQVEQLGGIQGSSSFSKI